MANDDDIELEEMQAKVQSGIGSDSGDEEDDPNEYDPNKKSATDENKPSNNLAAKDLSVGNIGQDPDPVLQPSAPPKYNCDDCMDKFVPEMLKDGFCAVCVMKRSVPQGDSEAESSSTNVGDMSVLDEHSINTEHASDSTEHAPKLSSCMCNMKDNCISSRSNALIIW